MTYFKFTFQRRKLSFRNMMWLPHCYSH
jgi:hypothetical protein